MKTYCSMVGVVVIALAARPSAGQTPLGTGFTYQGHLKQNGSPANGNFNMEFRLFDVPAGGTPLGLQTEPAQAVANGLFTVQLDFGTGAFDGNKRWLDITVNGTPLVPRQELTAAPYARFAAAPWAKSGTNISYTGGNVGIGTTVPDATLKVQGVVGATEGVIWGGVGSNLNTDQGGSMELGPMLSNGGETPYLDFHYGGNTAQDFSARIVVGGDDQLDFVTSTGGYAMSIVGDKLGIGTPAPQALLHVAGAGRFDGTLSALGGITLPTTTRYFSVAGNAFAPASDAIQYSTSGNVITGSTAGQFVTFFAAVHLPHGAVLSGFEAQIFDNSAAEDIHVNVYIVYETGFAPIVPFASSSGSSPDYRTISFNAAPLPLTIDNDVASYSISCHWFVPATTADIRLVRVRLAYTVTTPLP